MNAATRHNLDVRANRRYVNYWFAKGLGFTGKEATKMCKWGQPRIIKEARRRGTYIAKPK